MIHVIMGLKGSGKTKKLIDAINAAVADAHGDVVCIEYGNPFGAAATDHVFDGFRVLKMKRLEPEQPDITCVVADGLQAAAIDRPANGAQARKYPVTIITGINH